MRLRLLLAMILLASGTLVPSLPALAAENSAGIGIEVKEGQLVTFSTQAGSLEAVLRELCAKANVDLRDFQAADRPVTAAYHDVPLREVLERMLRQEGYMVGVRGTGDKKRIEVTWLNVTASRYDPNAKPAAPPRPPEIVKMPSTLGGLGLPEKVVVDALASNDAAKRQTATQALAAHFEANPGYLDKLLSKDFAATVDDLVVYPYAYEALQAVSNRQQDPVNHAKMDAMVKSLRIQGGVPDKKPSFAELMDAGVPR